MENAHLLKTSNDFYLENLSAFLSDVDVNEYDPENWSVLKTNANKDNGKRAVDASDASFILSFYAFQQIDTAREPHDIWIEVLGKDNVITAN